MYVEMRNLFRLVVSQIRSTLGAELHLFDQIQMHKMVMPSEQVLTWGTSLQSQFRCLLHQIVALVHLNSCLCLWTLELYQVSSGGTIVQYSPLLPRNSLSQEYLDMCMLGSLMMQMKYDSYKTQQAIEHNPVQVTPTELASHRKTSPTKTFSPLPEHYLFSFERYPPFTEH